ncbi:hypothetical protein H4R34_004775 [Dimargaris verticillata]|uniref:Uncharacterized protein n=1 Tax=Dimargaris verticillata TaxID=2761393 RepID=A0A9W8B4W9_9FUNG|nr:hypothetical protein H4R34_004775 [Dimargaris verticillata]
MAVGFLNISTQYATLADMMAECESEPRCLLQLMANNPKRVSQTAQDQLLDYMVDHPESLLAVARCELNWVFASSTDKDQGHALMPSKLPKRLRAQVFPLATLALQHRFDKFVLALLPMYTALCFLNPAQPEITKNIEGYTGPAMLSDGDILELAHYVQYEVAMVYLSRHSTAYFDAFIGNTNTYVTSPKALYVTLILGLEWLSENFQPKIAKAQSVWFNQWADLVQCANVLGYAKAASLMSPQGSNPDQGLVYDRRMCSNYTGLWALAKTTAKSMPLRPFHMTPSDFSRYVER